MTIHIFNDFFQSEIFLKCQEFSQSVIENGPNKLRTNLVWKKDIVLDSSLVLIYDVTPDSQFYKMLEHHIIAKIHKKPTCIMFYYWLPGSHIPWHNDGCHHSGLTIYLNEHWNKNHGGIFLYEHDSCIQGIYPYTNRAVLNENNVNHSVCPTTSNSEIRKTIQCFF